MQRLMSSGVKARPLLSMLVMLHTENTSSPIICVAATHALPAVHTRARNNTEWVGVAMEERPAAMAATHLQTIGLGQTGVV